MPDTCDRCGHTESHCLMIVMRKMTSYSPQRAKLCQSCMHEAERFLTGALIPGVPLSHRGDTTVKRKGFEDAEGEGEVEEVQTEEEKGTPHDRGAA